MVARKAGSFAPRMTMSSVPAMKATGTIVEIGAFTDVSGSVILVRAESEAAALDILRADVYMANGVWVELRARPFNRLAG